MVNGFLSFDLFPSLGLYEIGYGRCNFSLVQEFLCRFLCGALCRVCNVHLMSGPVRVSCLQFEDPLSNAIPVRVGAGSGLNVRSTVRERVVVCVVMVVHGAVRSWVNGNNCTLVGRVEVIGARYGTQGGFVRVDVYG